MSRHVNYHVNVAQVLGIVGGLALGFRALKLEETKAGIQHRPMKDVLYEDAAAVHKWWNDNFGHTRQYRHY